MPELREMFEVTTKQIEPDVDAWREQEVRQHRSTRNKRIGAIAVAAAIGIAAIAVIFGIRDNPNAVTPLEESPTSVPGSLPSPFFLDLRTGERRLVPDSIVPDDLVLGVGVFYSASPDGTRLAYSTCHGSSCSGADEMAVGNVDGTDARPLRVPGGLDGYSPRWSPNGTTLVYQLRYSGTDEVGGSRDVGELFLHDMSTGRRTQLTELDLDRAGWWYLSARFAPDGRSVVFHLPRRGGANTEWDVWSVPVTGGDLTLVLRNATFPVFLPDGEIAFVMPSADNIRGRGIAIASADGSRRTLVEANESIWNPSLSPDGTRIAYVDGYVVSVVDVSTGEASAVAEGSDAAWFDDDTLIVSPVDRRRSP